MVDDTSFYVEILPFIGTRESLIYCGIPGLQVGSLVSVPLRHRTSLGIVCRMISRETLKSEFQGDKLTYEHVADILYKYPVLTPDLIYLARWLLSYYGSNWKSVLETILPAMVRHGRQPQVDYGFRVSSRVAIFRKNSTKQQALYMWLQKKGPTNLAKIREQWPQYSPLLKALLLKSYIEKFIWTESNLLDCSLTEGNIPLILTDTQTSIAQEIIKDLGSATNVPHLLMGITGSGKTEIYHAVIEQAHHLGLQTLYLVPEIVLTGQALQRILKRLKPQKIRVELWHSQLTERERLRIWHQVLSGQVDVLLGTRSALFAPFPHLGLVVVDEEHEPSYKQSDHLRYHARDVAIKRAQLANAVCLLGSATPSLETWGQVKKRCCLCHKLEARPHGRTLPQMHIVDMRYEKPSFEGTYVLSSLLKEKLMERLERGEQSILFLNRRGYAPFLKCKVCNQRISCPYCNSHLVYHQEKLKCHTCDYTTDIPCKCPHCGGPLTKSLGLGTQRIERCLQRFFPQAKLLRLDTDTNFKLGWYEQVLQHQYDILVGTQMVAKGIDFPDVTLVGIIQADGLLNVNDFRATERTFQLLVQVSGRAGRADKSGEVVVQTFSPQADCIQFGIHGEIEKFLECETHLRQKYGYPPYSHLVRQIIRSYSETTLRYTCQQWKTFLQQNLTDTSIRFLGPSAPPLYKVRSYHRQHLLFFLKDVVEELPNILQLQKQFRWPAQVRDVLDVDPIDFV